MSVSAARRDIWPVLLFLFCAFPVLVMSALLTPMGQSPDETSHIARADSLLHGNILLIHKTVEEPGAEAPIKVVGTKINAGLSAVAWGNYTQIYGHAVSAANNLSALHQVQWQHQRVFINIPNTAAYFPLAYIPGAVGLGIGKAIGLSPFNAVTLGRLATALAYVLIGAAALALANFGRPVLLAILLFPISLFLGGTFDQDGILIALSCLACAGLTRETEFGRAVAFASFVVVLLAKPPYLPMLAIFALPLARPGFWRRAGTVIVASLPVIVWAVIVILFVSVPVIKPSYHPGILFTGPAGTMFSQTDATANLHIMLADKARFITLPLHTLHIFGFGLLQEVIGKLGYKNLCFPDWFYECWWSAGVLALVSLLFTRRSIMSPIPMALLNNIAVLGLFVITAWLVILSFYFSWTQVGQDFIEGLQGRYVLLLLPFLPLAIPALGAWLPEAVPMFPIFLLGLLDIGYVPLKLAQFYYVH
nr:DUF2142 domain-containing protein [Acidocella sp. MX-AZ02]